MHYLAMNTIHADSSRETWERERTEDRALITSLQRAIDETQAAIRQSRAAIESTLHAIAFLSRLEGKFENGGHDELVGDT